MISNYLPSMPAMHQASRRAAKFGREVPNPNDINSLMRSVATKT